MATIDEVLTVLNNIVDALTNYPELGSWGTPADYSVLVRQDQPVGSGTSQYKVEDLPITEQTLVGRITGGDIAALTAAQGRTLLNVSDGANNYTHPNHSGDVTSVSDGAQTIAADAVTYAKMQNVSATDKVLGRQTAGAGDVEEIPCTAAGRALIDDASSSAQRTTLGLGTAATMVGPAGTIIGTTDSQTLTNKTIDAANNTITNIGKTELEAAYQTRAGVFHIANPVAGDEVPNILLPDAVHFVRVRVHTDTGTATVNIEHRAKTAPFSAGTDIVSSDIVGDSTGVEKTSVDFASSGAVAADRHLYATVASVTGTPTKVKIDFEYTVD